MSTQASARAVRAEVLDYLGEHGQVAHRDAIARHITQAMGISRPDACFAIGKLLRLGTLTEVEGIVSRFAPVNVLPTAYADELKCMIRDYFNEVNVAGTKGIRGRAKSLGLRVDSVVLASVIDDLVSDGSLLAEGELYANPASQKALSAAHRSLLRARAHPKPKPNPKKRAPAKKNPFRICVISIPMGGQPRR